MSQTLRHAVLGAGGIGGLMGACLARLGDAVTMVVRAETLEHFPRQIHLESPLGNVDRTVSRAAEVPACDLLWITVKATQLEPALRSLTNPEAVRALVPLLNGIEHLALLRKSYGTEKIIPATIAVESERIAPGRFVQRSPFARLQVSSTGRALLGRTLDDLRQIGFDCRLVDDEPTLMWSKLVFLAPLALSTTAAGLTVGGVTGDLQPRKQWQACVHEAAAVATAEGAKVDAELVIAGILKSPAHMRSSMQKDVEQGKVPELDAIAGPILRGAQRHGIDVPATKTLVAAVEAKAGLPASIVHSAMSRTEIKISG
jgi:2-dehydropantoate 2-reductase